MTFIVDLDVYRDAETLEEFTTSVQENLIKDRAITMTIIEYVGPAGGNPIVRFASDDHMAIGELILDYLGDDAPEDYEIEIEQI